MLNLSMVNLVLMFVLDLVLPAAGQYATRLVTIHKLSCERPRSVPQTDPIFGLGVAICMFKSDSEGQSLVKSKEQHERYGATF